MLPIKIKNNGNDTIAIPADESREDDTKDHLEKQKSNGKGVASGREYFDSGVQSMSSLSLSIDNLASESELQPSIEVSPSSASSENPTLKEVRTSCMSETNPLDSGIDIGTGSTASCSSDLNAEKSTISRKIQQKQKRKSDYSCQLYFSPDEDGNTQLHIAIINGLEDALQTLLGLSTQSTLLDLKNYYSQCGLHLAVLLNQPSTVRKLVISGAKAGLVDCNGDTPLHIACKHNLKDCVTALLEPTTIYEDNNPPVVKFEPKVDHPIKYINEYNYDGLSCAHIAARSNNVQILHQLLAFGANINAKEFKSGYTILHEMTRCGNENLVRYILQHADVNVHVLSYARLTPYQLSWEYPKIGDMLAARGAKRLMCPEEESEDEFDDDEDEEDYSDEVHKVSGMMSSLNTANVAVTVSS